MVDKVFWKDLEFHVPEGVYVPREDSYLSAEVLVDQSLESKKVLDVGTGSGFLAVIASSLGAEVEALDINPKAVEVARENARRNSCSLEAFRSDLFEEVTGSYDIITFNAPYLPEEKEEGGDYENMAWEGGEEGRETIDRFIESAGDFLNEGGYILLTQIESNGVDRTLSDFEDRDLTAEVVGRKKIPWQELVVVKASKI